MWIIDLFCFLGDLIFDAPIYKHRPGRWIAEHLLGWVSVVCIVLAFAFTHRPLLLIILLVLGIGLLVYSFVLSNRTLKDYQEIRELEIIQEAEQLRKKRNKE